MFVIFYLVMIIFTAKVVNVVSSYWPGEEGNWAIITPEAYFPGFLRERDAKKHIKEKGWKAAKVVRLVD